MTDSIGYAPRQTQGYLRDLFAALDHELETMFSDGIEVRAARDHAHLLAGQGQLDRQISAYRTGAINAELHPITRALADGANDTSE